MVFTEAALLTIGAMMVVAAGLPMIGRLVEPARWGPRYPVPERTRSGSRAADVKRSFRPLDLGPDPVRWPSEIARPDLGPELPDWPSHHWDDPHFGERARKARRAEAHRAAEAAHRRQDPSRSTPEPSEPAEARPARGEAPSPPPGLPRSASDLLVLFDRELRDEVPGLDEIEHLMAQHGLAGTVKVIMDRTGWDFRQAAQHLARVRRRS